MISEHPQLRADGELDVAVDDERAVVREHEAATCPITTSVTLTYQVSVVADERVVDRVGRGAEQVPALAERVRDQVPERLALEQQEREVVGGDVDRGDRHQRVDEAHAAAGRRESPGRPSARPPSRAGRSPRRAATPPIRPIVPTILGAVTASNPSDATDVREVLGRSSATGSPGVRPSNVTVPIITDDERHRAGAGVELRQPGRAAAAARPRGRASRTPRCARTARSRPRTPRRAATTSRCPRRTGRRGSARV